MTRLKKIVNNLIDNISLPSVLCALLMTTITILANEYAVLFVSALNVPFIVQVLLGAVLIVGINIIFVGATIITLLDW